MRRAKIRPTHRCTKIFLSTLAILFHGHVFAAASQILNDNFFQNPAELSTIHEKKIIAGTAFIVPKFEFIGTSYGSTGRAQSSANDTLPYLLTAYRINDRFVIGFNATPSGYGHLNWPQNSIVSQAGTLTKVLFYRFAAQSSYQLTNDLAIGLGLNLEDEELFELNWVVPNRGNEINKISGINTTVDAGLFYKINKTNFVTASIYSYVSKLGAGTSTLGNTVSYQFAMPISQAPVVLIGLQHYLSENWYLSEKIYWSGWSLQKNGIFSNTAVGTVIVPTNWQDAWSFQFATRFSATEQLGILMFGDYETNMISPYYNQIGYPLSAYGSLSAGLDVKIKQNLSTQIVYGYGTFLPNANIKNTFSNGIINLNLQSLTLQFVYKS